MGHRILSPWQTDVHHDQCTSACANEEVIVDAMCHQLPANSDGEVNATCRLLHGEATSERGRASATHANERARASPYTRGGQRGPSSTEGEATKRQRDRPTSVALDHLGPHVNDAEISTRT